VIDHGDQLREAFETHEHLAPDPAAVYARVQELARAYHRRRRGAQVASGAVLGAGLIAGAVNLPGLLPARPSDSATLLAPAAAPAPATSPSAPSPSPSAPSPFAPSPSAPPSEAELQKQWDAYFAAGYDYDDAVKLAKIWNSKDEIGTVKAEAGRRLLAGETLPVKPSPDNVADAKEQRQVEAFFAAGYDVDDAVQLARLWKTADAYEAKVLGGRKLLAGETLPVKPSPGVADAKVQRQVEAFFAAGYDYDDAVKLARLWKLSDPTDAKAEAGKRLLAGRTLPIRP
jgi:hypothetical protein